MAGAKTRLAKDFRDLSRVFVAHDVRFMAVGAYALAVLWRPRATGDLDVWIDATPDNATRTLSALREFGAPLGDLSIEDLSRPGVVDRIGLPPLQIDVLRSAPRSAPENTSIAAPLTEFVRASTPASATGPASSPGVSSPCPSGGMA